MLTTNERIATKMPMWLIFPIDLLSRCVQADLFKSRSAQVDLHSISEFNFIFAKFCCQKSFSDHSGWCGFEVTMVRYWHLLESDVWKVNSIQNDLNKPCVKIACEAFTLEVPLAGDLRLIRTQRVPLSPYLNLNGRFNARTWVSIIFM